MIRIHDAFGKLYNEYGIGSGYCYASKSSTEIFLFMGILLRLESMDILKL